jgi:uncharacterized membrane protein YphA (DoxX/SURF4 family)
MKESRCKTRGQTIMEWTAAVALAAMWLVTGLYKLSDLDGMQVRMTQMLVPRHLSFAAALFFGTAETFTALLLLVPRWRRWGAWLSAGLLASFMVWIGVHYRALTGADCSCFPWLKRAVNSWFFLEDGAMIAVAVMAGRWSRPSHGLGKAVGALAAVLALAAGLFAADRARGRDVMGPASITVDGQQFPLREGRVLLFFFNPYCPHCFAAAQNLSRLRWNAVIIGLPTQAFEEGKAFFVSAGVANARLSPDIDKLRPVFAFQDVPYAAALENGKLRGRFVFFEEPDLGNTLRKIGFIR